MATVDRQTQNCTKDITKRLKSSSYLLRRPCRRLFRHVRYVGAGGGLPAMRAMRVLAFSGSNITCPLLLPSSFLPPFMQGTPQQCRRGVKSETVPTLSEFSHHFATPRSELHARKFVVSGPERPRRVIATVWKNQYESRFSQCCYLILLPAWSSNELTRCHLLTSTEHNFPAPGDSTQGQHSEGGYVASCFLSIRPLAGCSRSSRRLQRRCTCRLRRLRWRDVRFGFGLEEA